MNLWNKLRETRKHHKELAKNQRPFNNSEKKQYTQMFLFFFQNKRESILEESQQDFCSASDIYSIYSSHGSTYDKLVTFSANILEADNENEPPFLRFVFR